MHAQCCRSQWLIRAALRRDVKGDLRSLREGYKKTFVSEYFDELEPHEAAATENSSSNCVMSTTAPLIGALIDLSNHQYFGACSALSKPSAAVSVGEAVVTRALECVRGAKMSHGGSADKRRRQAKKIDSDWYTDGHDQLDGQGQGVRTKRKAAQTAEDALYARVLQQQLNHSRGANKRPRAKPVHRSTQGRLA